MNALPTHKEIAFFLPTKAAARSMTEVNGEVVKERLQLLSKPKAAITFDEQTPQQEVEGFYQCMATLSGHAREYSVWMHLEQQWLTHKLESYWAHLRAICKAEDVALMRGQMIKFPWEAKRREYGAACHIADDVFRGYSQALVQQRIANYHVDESTKENVLQWMREQGIKF